MTDNTLYTLKVTGVKDTAATRSPPPARWTSGLSAASRDWPLFAATPGFGASQADQIRLRDMFRAGTLPAPYETSIYSALTTRAGKMAVTTAQFATVSSWLLKPELHVPHRLGRPITVVLEHDDTPAGMPVDPACGVITWTNQNVWDKEPDNQASAAITLAQGSKYYFQSSRLKAWRRRFRGRLGTASNAGTIEVVPGSALVARINSDNSTVTITQQPVDTIGVVGKSATFTVTATGSSDVGGTLTYAWKKNGTP
jgi:hypothetical protein